MIDKINRGFAALAKVHCYVYALLGVIAAFVLMFFWGRDVTLTAFNNLQYLILLVFIISHILPYIFYKRHEIGGKKMPRTTSMIIKDEYFFEKISSNISGYKKTVGYLYVIFRMVEIILISFILSFALFMWLTRGV